MPNIKQLSAHALVVRRFVDVPSTFQALTQQASKSVISALPATRRIIVEAGTPELDPTSPSFKPDELVGFARDLGETLLSGSFLPASKPNVKLLFVSTADATMAGASILTTSLPVSVLGYETAVGPRDGAFLVGSPSATIADLLAYEEVAQATFTRLLDVTSHPRVAAWMGRMAALDHHDEAHAALIRLGDLRGESAATLGKRVSAAAKAGFQGYEVAQSKL